MSISRPSPVKDPSNTSKPVKRFGLFTKRVISKQDGTKSTDNHGKTVLTKPARRSEESGAPPSSKRQAPEDKSGLQRHRSAPGAPPSRQFGGEGDDSGPGRGVYAAEAVLTTSSAVGHQDAGREHRSQGHTGFSNQNDLDRIDELDESFLFNTRLHHDGPYEVTLREAGFTSRSRMPLGLSDNGRLHQHHERTWKAIGQVYKPPEVPEGVPLNLSPGQLLPRNFRRIAAKPPRFRSHLVSPLPPQENTLDAAPPEERVVPPRHANFGEIPFHKGAAQKRGRPPRQKYDNPLDGPPIDPGFAIGLAMMRFEGSGEDDKSLLETPTEDAKPSVVRGSDPEKAEDYDPYAPENIEEPSTREKEPENDQPKEASSGSPTTELEARDAPGGNLPYDSSPLVSPHLSLPDPGQLNGASEETLVQKEDEGAQDLQERQPLAQEVALHIEEILAKKVGQGEEPNESPPTILAPQHDDVNPQAAPPSYIYSLMTQPSKVQNVPQANEPTVAARYQKQLPPHPPATPPPRARNDQVMGAYGPVHEAMWTAAPLNPPIPQPASEESHSLAVPSARESREWKNSALQKAILRASLQSDARSTSSHQSVTSTRANDGHTPAITAKVTSSSKGAPQAMMSQESSQTKLKTSSDNANGLSAAPVSRISRRDPIFLTDSFTRYPKPSPLSGPPSTAPPPPSNAKPYFIPSQRPIQRRNSTSSKHSSNLHTIQEDEDSFPSTGSFERPKGPSHRSDPRPSPGLQRSQSSAQPRTMPIQVVEIGQVYPRHLQNMGAPLQRSVSNLGPSGQPPAYTEEPPTSRRAPSSHSSGSGSERSYRERREDGDDRRAYRGEGRSRHGEEYRRHGEEDRPHRSQREERPSRREEEYRHRPSEERASWRDDENRTRPSGERREEHRSRRDGARREERGYGEEERRMQGRIPYEAQFGPQNQAPRQAERPQPMPQMANPVPRPYGEERNELRVLHPLSGVPENVERRGDRQPSVSPKPPREESPRRPYYGPEQQVLKESNRSKPPSISPTTASSATGMGGPPRQHVPKKLVMPTPLQGTQPQSIQAKHFNDIFTPRPTPTKRYGKRSTAPRREPSPPTVLPPMLSAEDYRSEAALSAGRKLKKRTSYVPPPPPNVIQPHAALKFDPVVVQQFYSPPSPLSDKAPSQPRLPLEKSSKKVLSKKRTNL